ncbi:uncharacterized protein BX664DRAFT_338959 [Halteromyces radiatus]|uniref:uncharacterized protein n=1 Tax=Halteromyces radiatus TaxID=101107 RepID=UPI002220ED87|nr:uncharacterized protein BX664DRAFT_338959 [Halteromyces radiatus]KAI8082742.1 hypothetical protein BX664DRAFT_338959 [Halteromyces radiatus]
MQTSQLSSASNNIINKEQQTAQKRRRRRRRRQKNKRSSTSRQQTKQEEQTHSFASSLSQDTRLDLKDLTREASALEKQLGELQTQLNINYTNFPKDQGRRANAIANEQVTATEEEIDYVRKRLKTVYRQILTNDLLYASSQRIEDRLWRYIFYPVIEETRSQLRKLKPNDSSTLRQKLATTYHQDIDTSFKFYRDLNHNIKTTYHIDTKTIGIDVFRHQITNSMATDEDKVALLLQSNYICMGDLARYHASFASSNLDKDSSKENHTTSRSSDAWKVSKTCYQKAIDVYRSSGKPYSQLALVSASTGSVIDVVWYYCMSLGMKHPSSLGYDNLKSFYSKVRFTTKTISPQQLNVMDNIKPSQCISHYVESFLQMHHAIVFQNSDNFPPMSTGLVLAMTQILTTAVSDQHMTKTTSSTLHIIRSTLTRAMVILLISVWHLGERIKNKANFNQRFELQHLQMILLNYGFDMLITLYKETNSTLERLKKTASSESSAILLSLTTLVDNTLLPALSIWCTFLYTNMDIIGQYCHGADGRNTSLPNGKSKETTKRSLVRSIQTFCSLLIGYPSFPVPVNNILPSVYPLSEDVLLLGLVPLIPFHASVDFFKETAYEVDEQVTSDARKQVRWGRVREFIRKMADSTSFDFVQYNQVEQNYSVIDENAKRQQQSRFMKALATQRLMEQVSSLEKNVSNMAISPNGGGQARNKMTTEQLRPDDIDIYTVVVDATAFLDGLTKVKRWANQTLNVRSRIQTSVLQVVVPLDVIDVLDRYKKGDSHMNLQARESIRYLDQQLTVAADHNKQNEIESNNIRTRSFLRTQRVEEKLDDWDQASTFYIDHKKNNSQQEQQQSAHLTEENSNEPVLTDVDDVDDTSMSSDDDLFKTHGRRRGRRFDQDETDSEVEDLSTDDDEDYSTDDDDDDNYADEDEDEDMDSEDLDEDEQQALDQDDDEDNDDEWSFMDIPKMYRPILTCLLYFYQQQQRQLDSGSDSKSTHDNQVEHLVLVTNDDNLTKWAERFGDPSTCKPLSVYSVAEWDHILNTKSFERMASHPSQRRRT